MESNPGPLSPRPILHTITPKGYPDGITHHGSGIDSMTLEQKKPTKHAHKQANLSLRLDKNHNTPKSPLTSNKQKQRKL